MATPSGLTPVTPIFNPRPRILTPSRLFQCHHRTRVGFEILGWPSPLEKRGGASDNIQKTTSQEAAVYHAALNKQSLNSCCSLAAEAGSPESRGNRTLYALLGQGQAESDRKTRERKGGSETRWGKGRGAGELRKGGQGDS